MYIYASLAYIVKRFLYISSLLVFAIALASCSKDEVESPAETSNAHALKVDDNQSSDQIQENQNADYTNTGPLYINDDGDDEDEGINKTKTKK